MVREARQCPQCGRTIYFDGICQSCRAEMRRREILALTEPELAAKIAYISENIGRLAERDEVYDLCKKLIGLRDIDTRELAALAWAKRQLDLPEVYKDAAPQVVAQMLAELKREDLEPMTGNRLLLCLAEAGGREGDPVHQAFWELEQSPRSWQKQLYAPSSVYATYGGWSYDKQGRWLATNFAVCYPLVRAGEAEQDKSPVRIGQAGEGSCEGCGSPLVDLLVLDGRDPRLEFLGIDGILRVRCCVDCVVYEDDYFCRYELDGSCQPWHGEKCWGDSCMDEEAVAEMAANTYVLGPEPVASRYAADWDGGSSIGGAAFWIQDCVIKNCPECGRPMRYLAQIQWDNILEGMEGNAYIEICWECRIASVQHQQT